MTTNIKLKTIEADKLRNLQNSLEKLDAEFERSSDPKIFSVPEGDISIEKKFGFFFAYFKDASASAKTASEAAFQLIERVWEFNEKGSYLNLAPGDSFRINDIAYREPSFTVERVSADGTVYAPREDMNFSWERHQLEYLGDKVVVLSRAN